MKVLFLDQSGQLGGAELSLLDLMPHLGCDCQVVLFEHGRFEEALSLKGIRVNVIDLEIPVRRDSGVFAYLRSAPQVRRAVSQVASYAKGSDLIYANSPKAWIIAALAGCWTRTPLVLHLRDILSAGHFSSSNRKAMVFAANKMANAVIANSEASCAAFVQAGGRRDLVTVIPNGFDPSLFVESEGVYRKIHQEFGIGEAPLVVMPGRLARWKGQHVFIEALASLPGVHGAIIGDALFTDEDRTYASSLPEQARRLGCADRIHFCGWRRDVISILHEADVVVHCSIEPEPFGRVIVEAMACGRPTVVSGDGGTAEIVEHGRTGLHHLPGDAGSLASSLQRLLASPAEAEAMGKAARESVARRYTLSETAAKTKELLRQVSEGDSAIPRKAPPKILFLDQSGQLGGAELCLANVVYPYREGSRVVLFQEGPFVALLKQIGVDVGVEAMPRNTAAVGKESGAAKLVRSFPGMVALAAKIARLAAKYDLIYANTAKAMIAASVAAKWTGKPLIFHLHDIISQEHFSGVNRKIIVCASRFVRCWVIANSEATKEAFVAAGGNAARVTVIYNGFEIREPAPTPAEMDISGNRQSSPLLLMVGRITEWKGQHILLEAATRLPMVRVRFVGGALFTQADLRYAERLRERAEAPDLRGRIEFAGFQEGLENEYERASIVVHASIAPEPFGRVIVEAQLACRPVVATNLGGAREIVRHGETGWLVPPNDVQALAATLDGMLSNDARTRAVAVNGQLEARSRFGLAGIRAKTDGVVRRVLAEYRAERGGGCNFYN